jgi:hypothetical protein
LNEIKVVTDKTFKEFARNKMELMWTFLVPIFFLIIIPFMYSGVPAEMIVCLKGGLTLTMMNFLFAFVGQANLAGSIASDRAKGLYLKMNSMDFFNFWCYIAGGCWFIIWSQFYV